MKNNPSEKRKQGRPSLIEERQIREKLQKYLPDIYKFYDEVFKSSDKRLKAKVSAEILAKLVADKKEMEISGDSERPLGVVILPELRDEPKNNMEAPSGATD